MLSLWGQKLDSEFEMGVDLPSQSLLGLAKSARNERDGAQEDALAVTVSERTGPAFTRNDQLDFH